MIEIETRIAQLKEAGATPNQLFIFNCAKDFGLSPEEMNELLHLEFNAYQLKAMLDAYKAGATISEIKMFNTIVDGRPIYNSEQMEQIWKAQEAKLSSENIAYIARPSNSAKMMSEIRRKYVSQLDESKEYAQVLADAVSVIKQQEENIQKFIINYTEISDFIHRRCFELESECEDKDMRIREMDTAYVELEKENEWLKLQLEEVNNGRVDKGKAKIKEGGEGSTIQRIEESKLRKLIVGLDEERLEQVRLGIESGLNYEQIATYAKKDIPAERMKNMRLILETQLRKDV